MIQTSVKFERMTHFLREHTYTTVYSCELLCLSKGRFLNDLFSRLTSSAILEQILFETTRVKKGRAEEISVAKQASPHQSQSQGRQSSECFLLSLLHDLGIYSTFRPFSFVSI
jgi:hypothetical protein